jgi:hypothetical protein
LQWNSLNAVQLSAERSLFEALPSSLRYNILYSCIEEKSWLAGIPAPAEVGIESLMLIAGQARLFSL